MIDAVNDSQVGILAGRGYQHGLGAGLLLLLISRAVGEVAGAFKHQLDAQLAVRKVGWVALGGYADPLAIDDQILTLGGHLARIFAVDAIAGEEPGVGLGVREIVDGDELEPAIR